VWFWETRGLSQPTWGKKDFMGKGLCGVLTRLELENSDLDEDGKAKNVGESSVHV